MTARTTQPEIIDMSLPMFSRQKTAAACLLARPPNLPNPCVGDGVDNWQNGMIWTHGKSKLDYYRICISEVHTLSSELDFWSDLVRYGLTFVVEPHGGGAT